jgi:hypothetical protein
MRWRSPREILFRLNQEAGNAILLGKPPRLTGDVSAIRAPLPDSGPAVAALRETPAAAAIVREAREILAHRFALLGLQIETGPNIRWRYDYQNRKETAALYFRRVPYLDAARAGDHKVIWELNRHQHLVVLAQAYRLTGEREFIAEIQLQIESWLEANPFQCGINWASALEVAFRALSWMWIDHLAGAQADPAFRRRFLEGLYRHGHHLAMNLSVYFSPNTHLLGEAVALHALGLMFRGTPAGEEWIRVGRRVVDEQMERQVRPDGSHFEQSTYYHVYTLDMFLFHAALSVPGEAYREVLVRMAEYLDALMGPSRRLPSIGDDDGGRFFHPYGPRECFGRATLATCGVLLGRPEWIVEASDLHEQCIWWLGPQALQAPVGLPPERRSRWFPSAGVAVMVAGNTRAILKSGPFGPFRSGHSHADVLSLVVEEGNRDLLIDPGTFTYVGDPRWRDAFRGTAAHNTVRIDEMDQARPAGPFAWIDPPAVELRSWESSAEADELDAVCRYRGLVHRRRVRFVKAGFFAIVDDIDGPAGEHEIEQRWHPGPDAPIGRLVLEEPFEEEEGWRSPVFGEKIPARVVCVQRRTTLPCRVAAAVLVGSDSSVRIARSGDRVNFLWERAGGKPVTITL